MKLLLSVKSLRSLKQRTRVRKRLTARLFLRNLREIKKQRCHPPIIPPWISSQTLLAAVWLRQWKILQLMPLHTLRFHRQLRVHRRLSSRLRKTNLCWLRITVKKTSSCRTSQPQLLLVIFFRSQVLRILMFPCKYLMWKMKWMMTLMSHNLRTYLIRSKLMAPVEWETR